MQVRKVFLAAGLVVLLTGCGGGGSSPDSASEQPPPVDATTKAIDNAVAAAGEGLAVGDLVLGLSKQEVIASQTGLSAAGATTVGLCSNSDGSLQVNWTDASGDGLRGAGDTITIQYSNCTIAHTGSALNGTVLVTITSKTSSALQLTVDYGSGLLLVDQKDQTPSHVFGTKTVSWSDDGLSRQLAVSSSARDDLKLTSINADESTGRVYSEQLKSLALKNTLSREAARSSTQLTFQLISEFLGDTFAVSTPVDLSSYFDTYPDRGEVAIQSNSTGAITRLKALYTPDGSQLSYDAYTKEGVTPVDSGYAQWSDVTTGVMWWGEDWSGKNEFSASYIGNFSEADFKQLQATPLIASNAQLPVWTMQFSRPLDASRLPSLRLHRENLDSGDPYFWGPEVIPASVIVKGAYVTITPSEPLQHGLNYYLEAFDSGGAPLLIRVQDVSGNTAAGWPTKLTIDNSLIANISLPTDAPILTSVAQPILLRSADSQSANGLVSYQWTQVSGPPLLFGSADEASTTISLANVPSADTTATVQLRITDARGQVEYTRKVISIVPNPSSSVVLHVRSQAGDFIGGGKQLLSVPISGQSEFYTGYPPSYIDYTGNGPFYWRLTLYNGQKVPIQAGIYENVQLAPGSDTSNAIAFSAFHRGCNTVSGRFNVLEVAYDASGHVTKLAVDFDQYCNGSTAGLFGSFRYHSAIPVRP